tara:strand:+ start:1111 stop:1362 length:252 start_codon:yes stop_codon:yes gene_type:complete
MKNDKNTLEALTTYDPSYVLSHLLGALGEKDPKWLEEVMGELLAYTKKEDGFDDDNEPFDRDGWDDEAAFESAGMGMDESYDF